MHISYVIIDLQSLDQWLGMLFDGIEKLDPPNAMKRFQSEITEALREKKSNFQGYDYILELETNLVYGSEVTFQWCNAIARFLCLGEPTTKDLSQVEHYLQAEMSIAHRNVDSHLAFLRHGCRGCAVHNHHSRYQELRMQRLSRISSDYVHEVEFCYQLYQATSRTALTTAMNVLGQPHFARIGRGLALQDVASRTWQQVLARAKIWWQT